MAIYGVWDLRGNTKQNWLIQEALKACDFPFDRLKPSLQKEGKSAIPVVWRDLSRMSQAYAAQVSEGGHEHVHEGDATAHPLERKVNGRRRILGLFYLPPYTAIVLDTILLYYPQLAKEVFLSEAAHAVDYHYMNNEQRLTFWNIIHPDLQDLALSDTIEESGDQGHSHSWFDGPLGYSTWVGESWMEGFVKAFAPKIPITIHLGHSIPPEEKDTMRAALLGQPAAVQTSNLTGSYPVFTAGGSKTFHRSHKNIAQSRWYPSAAAATAAGLRPCGVCVT